MADEPEADVANIDAAPSNAELDAKVTALDSKIDTILAKLGGARDQAHGAAQRHTEDRLDRPSNIADEIRAQLDAQRAKDEAAARGQADADWRKGVDEKLSGMAEQAPEAPLRRVERMMGWR